MRLYSTEIKEDLDRADTEYSRYLDDHISNVVKGFDWIKEHTPELLEGTTTNLETEIKNHDASKYDPIEYNAYDDYFYGHYGDKKPPEVEYFFDIAWNHHQKNNPHHWQYWVVLKDSGEMVPLDMDYESIIHMICDWWSFSWKSGNLYEIFDWYKKNKANQTMSKQTKEIVEQTLEHIKNKLEELK